MVAHPGDLMDGSHQDTRKGQHRHLLACALQMMPSGSISASDIPNELASGKAYMLGCDKDGRAVLMLQAKKHNAWGRKVG